MKKENIISRFPSFAFLIFIPILVIISSYISFEIALLILIYTLMISSGIAYLSKKLKYINAGIITDFIMAKRIKSIALFYALLVGSYIGQFFTHLILGILEGFTNIAINFVFIILALIFFIAFNCFIYYTNLKKIKEIYDLQRSDPMYKNMKIILINGMLCGIVISSFIIIIIIVY